MFKKYLLWSLAISLLALSCEDDRDLVVLQLGDAPVITAPAAGLTVDITEATLGDQFALIKWNPADFGFAAGVSYTVEMDAAGNSFADAFNLAVTNRFEAAVTNEQVNTIMVAKGLPGGVFSSMEIRVRAKTSEEVDELISAPITVSVSPVLVEIIYPQLQVPGSYQGWDPANDATVIFSLNSDGVYEGFLFVANDDAEYKFTDGPSWDTNWGDTGADGTLDPGGDNMVLGAAGIYRFNADINALSHSALRTDWGVIGDATAGGWDNDTDMTYDEVSGVLTVDMDLTGGAFIKFRANDDWDINLGDTGADLKMEYGGDNIAVAETGNYTVELDLSKAVYTYTLTKN